MPAAIIVGAVIAVAGTLISAAITSSDTEDAAAMAKEMADQKRRDNLMALRSRERMEKLTLDQRKKEANMAARASRKELKQRKSEFAFGQREAQFGKTISLINGNQTMRNNFANLFKRGK